MNEIVIDPSRERRILDFRLLGFCDFLVLGHYVYRETRQPLQLHDHGELLEVCYLADGEQFYRVAGNDYFLRGGDVLINYPHEPHGTGFLREGKGNLYWLILQPPKNKIHSNNLPPNNTKILHDKLLNLNSRQFKLKNGSQKNLDTIFTLFEKENCTIDGGKLVGQVDSFFVMNVRNYLFRFFLDLVESGQLQHKSTPSPEIARAIKQIKNNDEPFYSMKQLARIASLSESRFKHRFKEEIGTTPADFQIRHKVDRACVMLRQDGKTILDTALSLGFSSSQYFATVFRRYTGITPAQFRSTNPPIN
ncbi:MAG: AraC family transcriptional regulator [Planctomycetaceae bacterium]|jgi:AraC-like DNA-binding protein/quercetin dioxygenase-like cupin family protein|nr:AraC family transcriptional regulator [Planctomycetaceae bacterium]